jgi:hypothetical protein
MRRFLPPRHWKLDTGSQIPGDLILTTSGSRGAIKRAVTIWLGLRCLK